MGRHRAPTYLIAIPIQVLRAILSYCLWPAKERDFNVNFQTRNRNEKRSPIFSAKLGSMAPANGPDYRSSHCTVAGQALDKQQIISQLCVCILATHTHTSYLFDS